MAGAKATTTDTERGTEWSTVTNAEGVYNLPRVPVGNAINSRSSMKSSETATQSDVTVQIEPGWRVLTSLFTSAGITQSVEVTSATPLLQTQSTQLGG